MRRTTTVLAFMLITVFILSCMLSKQVEITQGDLVRNTQERFDAAAAGDQATWQNISPTTASTSTKREEPWTKPLSSKT